MSGASDLFEEPAGIEPIRQFLVGAALEGMVPERVVEGFCRRLHGLGVPIDRVYVGLSTLHPQIRALGVTWFAVRGIVDSDSYKYSSDSGWWQRSPFFHMIANRQPEMRRRLAGPEAKHDFAVLREYADAGFNDWLALIFNFGSLSGGHSLGEIGLVSSWMTSRREGFSPSDLAVLRSLVPQLAACLKVITLSGMTVTLLATYIGADAAAHVLAGDIRRGSVQRLRAAILFADLRGFTALADRLSSEQSVAVLDRYLDCLGPPLTAAGGQILKFIGDGLLASFDFAGADEAIICDRALKAAIAAQQAVSDLNAARAQAGEPVLALDIALHCGEVAYGNVGTAERLDFTVIGPAVNEAARIEALCSHFDERILASRAFRDCAGTMGRRLVSLGRHGLRGVAAPMEIFALRG